MQFQFRKNGESFQTILYRQRRWLWDMLDISLYTTTIILCCCSCCSNAMECNTVSGCGVSPRGRRRIVIICRNGAVQTDMENYGNFIIQGGIMLWLDGCCWSGLKQICLLHLHCYIVYAHTTYNKRCLL